MNEGHTGPPPSDPVPADDASRTTEVSVQGVHRAVTRELDEPSDGHEPVPSWAILLFAVLLFWGGWYMATHSGGYSGKVLDERTPPPAAPVPKVTPTAFAQTGTATTVPGTATTEEKK